MAYRIRYYGNWFGRNNDHRSDSSSRIRKSSAEVSSLISTLKWFFVRVTEYPVKEF